MQLITLYRYDPSGALAENKVENESITITPPRDVRDWSYFCPRGAPFFADSLVVKTGNGATARTLIKDVDYRIVFDFVSATVATNKRICCGIALLNPSFSGTLYVTYQALGGEFTMSDFSILEEIVRQRYKTYHVAYEQIINLPEGFAPAWHENRVKDMVGMASVVLELQRMVEAIKSRSGSFSQLEALINHHIESEHAHTPANVGLGNVRNYDVATVQDIAAGATDKYITAGQLKSSIENIDMSHFATKTALTKAIEAANAGVSSTLMGDIEAKLSALASSLNTQIANLIRNSATKSELSSAVAGLQSSSSGFVSNETLNELKNTLPTTISSLATSAFNSLFPNALNSAITNMLGRSGVIKAAIDAGINALQTSVTERINVVKTELLATIADSSKFKYSVMPDLTINTNQTIPFSTLIGSDETAMENFLSGKRYRVITGNGECTINLDSLTGTTNDKVNGVPFTVHNRSSKVMKIVSTTPAVTKTFEPYTTATIVCRGLNRYDIIGGQVEK